MGTHPDFHFVKAHAKLKARAVTAEAEVEKQRAWIEQLSKRVRTLESDNVRTDAWKARALRAERLLTIPVTPTMRAMVDDLYATGQPELVALAAALEDNAVL